MRVNNLIKFAPFLSTLLLIIFLGINNQKQYTKLRILIWNTPSLTLGTYLTISTVTGFILSYLITNNISKINLSMKKTSLTYKDDHIDDNIETNTNLRYDNILIERDFNDPSPTINANFRIIGNKQRTNTSFVSDNHSQYNDSSQFEEQYAEQSDKNRSFNKGKSNSNDWNDESFSTW